jgi:hypothetical protein
MKAIVPIRGVRSERMPARRIMIFRKIEGLDDF